MSDVVKNDPQSGEWLLEPGESHDEFLELSALSTSEWQNPTFCLLTYRAQSSLSLMFLNWNSEVSEVPRNEFSSELMIVVVGVSTGKHVQNARTTRGKPRPSMDFVYEPSCKPTSDLIL